jgi:hypothetical protein
VASLTWRLGKRTLFGHVSTTFVSISVFGNCHSGGGLCPFSIQDYLSTRNIVAGLHVSFQLQPNHAEA